MALADKKHERFFSTTGSDADKVSSSKLAEVKDLWDKDGFVKNERGIY